MRVTVNAMHNGHVMCSAEGETGAEAARLVRILSRVLYPDLWPEFSFEIATEVRP